MTAPFSLLIKPASADCNMDCRYCFYLEKSSLYPLKKTHRMSEKTLKRLISSYMNTQQLCHAFGWQGGEPTLMGVGFFKEVVKLQQQYGKMGSVVSNGLQTNATLIDGKFARHLAKYRYLLGVSLDGPQYIHDHYRRFSGGNGSFKKVMKSIKILRNNDVQFNILVLVNDFNFKKAGEIYRFLLDNGFNHHQYIPCVEFDSKGDLEPFSINGEQWGVFLTELFKQWYPGDIYRVSIRLFDSILHYIVNGKSTICHMGDNCNQYFIVEYNGDVYPCDFFVRRKLLLGNVNKHSWEDILNSDTYREFGDAKSMYGYICSSCRYEEICHGDCLKHRRYLPESPSKLSSLCSGWKMFYNQSLSVFREIATAIKTSDQ